MKKRKPKPDDQEKADKALDLIYDLIEMNPQFETAIWMSACLSCAVRSFHSSGFTYDEYLREIQKAIKFYKRYWEEE